MKFLEVIGGRVACRLAFPYNARQNLWSRPERIVFQLLTLSGMTAGATEGKGVIKQ
jgi:hypothetical protein